MSSHLQSLLRTVPSRPGVYIMKDAEGGVIYVGKAAVLRSRLRTYFQAGAEHPIKVQQMVERVADLEWIVVDSEAEALLLESSLVKRHRPRFNVRLKDDKHYPYLKIPVNEPFARIYIARRIENDGARYFGPYASASSVRRTMDLVKKLFPYRSCTRVITGKDPRPCLDYYIHRCIGPCIGAASKEAYDAVIDQVVRFLEGRHEGVIRDLKRAMQRASDNLEYERAAVLRDQIRAIERTMEQQKLASTARADRDVLAAARGQDEACVMLFYVRGGKVVGREHFMMEGTREETDASILGAFIQQFYATAPAIPPEILLPALPPDAEMLADWLTARRRAARGALPETPDLDARLRAEREHDVRQPRRPRANAARVRLQVPVRGEKRQLVELVEHNAHEVLTQMRVRWLADSDRTLSALAELQEQLSLPAPPRRIECYDISNIQGTNAVGSMVVFENGQPKPAHYRRFTIKTVVGANDFASHQEVLRRRFRRGLSLQEYARSLDEGLPDGVAGEGPGDAAPGDVWQATRPNLSSRPERKADPSFQAFPDLIIIDGGRGQLNAGLLVLRELGLNAIPMVGLAKEQELVFVPDEPDPVYLPRNSQALYLVQRIRDEAHRFAITFHRQRRARAAVRSGLDAIPGVGPRRKKALLQRFGSVAAIREASPEELSTVPGVTPRLAATIHAQL